MRSFPFLFIVFSFSLTNQSLCQNVRSEFVAALSRVKTGMTVEQVEAVVGLPSHIISRTNSFQFRDPHVEKVFWYGSDENTHVPSLGQIHFGFDQKVFKIFGQDGVAFQEFGDGFEELELRQAFNIIGQTPSFDGQEFNPAKLIEAVNFFQRLGKNRSVAIFREYERVSWIGDSPHGSIFLLVNCLHEIPNGHLHIPRPRVGLPAPNPPRDLELPRFPIYYLGDVPILLVRGYHGAGEPESIDRYLVRFEQEFFEWLEDPIPADGHTEESLQAEFERFRESKDWYFTGRENTRATAMIESQIRRVLDHLRQPRDADKSNGSGVMDDSDG